MQFKCVLGTFLIGAIPILSVAEVQPAYAFSWDDNRATIESGDIDGTSFSVIFNGYIEEALTEGLTAEAVFSLVGDYNGGSSATFDVLVKNTSSVEFFTNTRISGLGFNTNPELDEVTVDGAIIDNYKLNSPIPQPPVTGGQIDVCFTVGNSCTGGGGDGVALGQSTTFRTTLTFSEPMNAISFDLTDFRVRYQSIDFKDGTTGASGVGVNEDESGVGVGRVPTPALLPGLIGMGIAALRKKKQEAEKEAQSVV